MNHGGRSIDVEAVLPDVAMTNAIRAGVVVLTEVVAGAISLTELEQNVSRPRAAPLPRVGGLRRVRGSGGHGQDAGADLETPVLRGRNR